MKLASLTYLRPASLAEARDALRAAPGTSRVLAGGQSLIPALTLREVRADVLVDVSTLTELLGARVEGDRVVLGAAEPLRTIERSSQLQRALPLLHRALVTVAAMSIRSRCGLGGSLAWGDPRSQLPAALAASDAVITTTARTQPVVEFVRTPPLDRLAPDEIIVSVTVPVLRGAGVGLAHVRRTHITWPTAGALATVASSGRIALALYGAGPTHVVAHADRDEDVLEQAIGQVADLDDGRAGVLYRRQVLPVLARRALAQARRDRDGAH